MDSFAEFVTERLQPVKDLKAKRMFGGIGLYSGERFFGIIFDGRVYFKVDDSTRPKYEEAEMGPFRAHGKPPMKKYYEVPPDVVEDSGQLIQWAAESARLT